MRVNQSLYNLLWRLSSIMEGLLSATDTFFPIISLTRLLAIESRLVGNSIFGALIIVRV